MNWTLAFEPLLPVWLLAAIGVVGLLFILPGLIRRMVLRPYPGGVHPARVNRSRMSITLVSSHSSALARPRQTLHGIEAGSRAG